MKISKFFSGRQSAHSEILRMKLSVSCAGSLILCRVEKSSLHPFRQSARNCFKNSTDSLKKNAKEPCRFMKSVFSMYRQDLRHMLIIPVHFYHRKSCISALSAVYGQFAAIPQIVVKTLCGFFYSVYVRIPFGSEKMRSAMRDVDLIFEHDFPPFGFRPSGLDCSPAFDFLKMQTGGLSICIRPELLRPVISTHPKKRMQWNVE